ncbi:MAG: nucleotidyltransferase domain-containing protein [Flavipsychrobacter sp.]|nr:nucleotidyltransferase domain-containing protein [Flavipsychrobacter sp.]
MSIIEEFAKKKSKNWDEIFNAEKVTADNFNLIRKQLLASDFSLTSSDAELVVFGSIARNECTSHSDVDWTLLVDGQANPNHLNVAHLIEKNLVSTGLAKHGTSGMFGQITFSHDLIHYVGGQDDTNHNLSKRILLLLESASITNSGNEQGTALDRVIRGIIGKYIDNDSGYAASGKENVPRFLLNDIIRFWRTMCVDFAYKQIEQHGQKWALRNIKLRMARRLIFVKGLLMCAKLYNTQLSLDEIKQELRKFALMKPLEFMVSTFLEFNIQEDYIVKILDAYNSYLGMLNDESFRHAMSTLDMHQAYGNEKFEYARENSHLFLDGLASIFLKDSNEIGKFTIKYGVF